MSTAAIILCKIESMKTIGLVGGIASGKSLVAKLLVERGAGLLDADHAGHAVLAENADVRRRCFANAGATRYSTRDGTVNRLAIARHVFAADRTPETQIAASSKT